LIDFEWVGREWSYKPIKDCLGNNINDRCTELCRVETSIAEEMLGIHLALDGDMLQQAEKMRQMAITWVSSMRKGKLSRAEAWVTLISTLWHTLSYLPPALHLMKDYCERIIRAVRYGHLSKFSPSSCVHF
jgi:hypothetical protein